MARSSWNRLLLVGVFQMVAVDSDLSIQVDTSQDRSTGAAYANKFSQDVAIPLLQTFPRSYSSEAVLGQVSVSGFFSVASFNYQARVAFKQAILTLLNQSFQQSNDCCTDQLEVMITNVCLYDFSSCVTYMLQAQPQDCGDSRRVDPEQCDDGNRVDGDGCSQKCLVEPGFTCTGGSRFHKDLCQNSSAPIQTIGIESTSSSSPSVPTGTSVIVNFRIVLTDQAVLDWTTWQQCAASHAQSTCGPKPTKLVKMDKVLALIGTGFLSRLENEIRGTSITTSIVYTSRANNPGIDRYSGAPRAFFHSFLNGTDLSGCTSNFGKGLDFTACAYVDFVLSTAIAGLVLSFVMFFGCVGFCLGRLCPFFECCGRPCKEPNCGGPIPTKRYKSRQRQRVLIVLMIICALNMTISIIGYEISQELSFYIVQSLNALESAKNISSSIIGQTKNLTAAIKIRTRDRLNVLNLRLSGLPDLLILNEKARASLQKFETAIAEVQSFIEGQPRTSLEANNCVYMDPITYENLTYDSASMIWLRPDGTQGFSLTPPGRHIYGTSISQILSNGRPAPHCLNAKYSSVKFTLTPLDCPCCRDCQTYRIAAGDATNAIPSEAAILRLNRTLDTSKVFPDIDNLSKNLTRGAVLLDQLVGGLMSSMQLFKANIHSLLNLFDLVECALWGLPWVGMFFIFVGLPRSSYCSMILAFLIGVVSCSFIYFPVFAFGAMIALPLGDLCSGLPRTGDDSSSFLQTFSNTGMLSDVNLSTISVVNDCIINPSGSMWNIAGMDIQGITDGLSRYSLTGVYKQSDISAALNTVSRDLTIALTNHYDAVERMTADNNLYGYDSMPISIDSHNVTKFQVGGILQGTNAILGYDRAVNIVLGSAYSTAQVVKNCIRPAYPSACYTTNASAYVECCPDKLFIDESRAAALMVVDYYIYKNTLADKIADAKSYIEEAQTYVQFVKQISQDQETNITRLVQESVDEVNYAAQSLLAAGQCNTINSNYEILLEQICVKQNVAMEGFWIVCFFAGLSWLPLFLVLLRAMKIAMLDLGMGKIRPGEPHAEEFEEIVADDGRGASKQPKQPEDLLIEDF